MTGGGGPPLNGPGVLRPPPSEGGGGKDRLLSLGAPRESVLNNGRLAADCNIRGGPVSPGGGTTALA
jgi:hypothetical protein